jgi:hypothetical protein
MITADNITDEQIRALREASARSSITPGASRAALPTTKITRALIYGEAFEGRIGRVGGARRDGGGAAIRRVRRSGNERRLSLGHEVKRVLHW